MKGYRLLFAAALAFLLWAASPGPMAAAEGGKPRIAALLGSRSPVYEEVVRGFRESLADAGRPARIDTMFPGDDPAAAERALKQADLVLALGSRSVLKAIGGAENLPVIAAMVMREESFREWGDNVTGVFLQHPLETQFRHIRNLLPKARNIGVIYGDGENGGLVTRAASKAAAEGFELVSHKVYSPGGIPGALESTSRSVDALWGIPDKVVLNPSTAREVLLFSFRNRIPFIGISSSWVKSGALFSLGWDYYDMGAQCGTMAAAVLGGQPAGTIPPEGPRKVRYSVNLKTAERMKLDLPESLVKDASEVY